MSSEPLIYCPLVVVAAVVVAVVVVLSRRAFSFPGP